MSGWINEDGFVKSPAAALRCNPAPLDNNPALGIRVNLLILEAEIYFEKYLTG
jgi:hypothetical protein